MRAQQQVGLVALAHPHLDRLVEATGLTSHLALLEREEVVYVAKVDSPGFVKFETHVGKHAPAQLTAVGKAILAYLPSAEFDEILPRLDLRRGTANASHSARELRRTLESVRSTGYAVEDEEEIEGVRCVAAPVLHGPGKGTEKAPARAVASVGVIGLKTTLSDERITTIGALVTQAAQAIAAEVGPGTPQN
jgi:DNA-binding IclR family transcriptional regulator